VDARRPVGRALELSDLDADHLGLGEHLGGGVQVGEGHAVGHEVVGGDDAGIQHVAVDVDVDGPAGHRDPELLGHRGSRLDQGDDAGVEDLLLGRVDVPGADQDCAVRGHAGAEPGVPEPERGAVRQAAEVAGRGGVGSVEVGVGVEPDDDGVGPVRGDDRQGGQGDGAAAGRGDRDLTGAEDAVELRGHRLERRPGRLQLLRPAHRQRRLWGSDARGRRPEPSRELRRQLARPEHGEIVVVAGAAGVVDERWECGGAHGWLLSPYEPRPSWQRRR
jgi:hypothetical protein